MLTKKNAEVSPIALIASAVIALIIIVIVIAMLSGKLGSFIKTSDESVTCDSLCRAAGYTGDKSDASPTIGIKDDEGVQCNCI